MEQIKLNNNNYIPQLGLGTYRNTEHRSILEAIQTALDENIFLIDTAQIYQNEAIIGNVLRELNVDRSKLFITSKVWNSNQGYDNTLKTFEQSLKNLDVEYLDMFPLAVFQEKI